MKKTAIAMLALTVGIVAASCQKEAEPEIKSFEPMTINAVSEGIGTATKTEMAYKYDILWSEDDQIYVTDGTSNDTFTLSDGEGTTKGTFTQDGTASFTSEVQAYYPATIVQDGGLIWPAAQSNNQTVPMYSTKTVSGNVEKFNFASLGSVLQIVFTAKEDDITLKSINIKDDNATMSGAFTVDTDGKANITATDKAGITLDLGDGVDVSNKIQYFNIAIPAGNYQALTLTFTATNGSKCVMKNGKVNIAHNTVGRLTLTGKEFEVLGRGKAYANGLGDVRWIQLWEGGPKFAEFNIGASLETGRGDFYNWGMSVARTSVADVEYNKSTTPLSGDDDTATKLWGENWRMPRAEEIAVYETATYYNRSPLIGGLTFECTCEWKENYKGTGVNGLLYIGAGDYSNNSVFFPVSGYFNSKGKTFVDSDTGGYYWTSDPRRYHLISNNVVPSRIADGDPSNGYLVRPVLKEE